VIAEKIVDEVFGLRLGIANAYLVRSADGGVTLIDTGVRRRVGHIGQGIREAFGPDARIRRIVLTHHHPDHTGSVDQLVALTGAGVYVHSADAALVDGTERRVPRQRLVRMLIGMGNPAPVDVNRISDGDVLPDAAGVRVIHTPGHTRGHVSLLLASPGGNVLFTGDAAGEFFGRVGPLFAMTTLDAAQARASYSNLKQEDFEVACFGHGKPIRSQAHRRFFGA
jgi:glyoxylase-like metal-dependent hydrolase (beta-lactamase superfamily II)